MPKFVIKKDGTEEPFDVEKLKQSIRINAIDAALTEAGERINKLVEEVSAKIIELIDEEEKISAEDIKEKVLNELDVVAPKVAEAWREYDRQIKTV